MKIGRAGLEDLENLEGPEDLEDLENLALAIFVGNLYHAKIVY
jgi:hypothetical protein